MIAMSDSYATAAQQALQTPCANSTDLNQIRAEDITESPARQAQGLSGTNRATGQPMTASKAIDGYTFFTVRLEGLNTYTDGPDTEHVEHVLASRRSDS